MWDGVAERLAAAGHEVVAVDQRGHGQSDKPDDGYDFATLTADLVAVIDALGVDQVIAAGQSWGANVVLELARRQPERLRGAALVDGGARDMAERLPDWEQASTVLAPPVFDSLRREDIEGYLRRTHSDWPEAGIAGALANFEARPDGTVAPWLTRDRHMVILRHLWEHRPTELLAELKVPVLVVAAVDYDAHHDIHAQKPDLVAKLLLDLI
jgi:pimeloyl-ACP methyl ester carboxylesterase